MLAWSSRESKGASVSDICRPAISALDSLSSQFFHVEKKFLLCLRHCYMAFMLHSIKPNPDTHKSENKLKDLLKVIKEEDG